MDALLQDLRIAARTLLRSPGFALVAVITLALGIGANTAIFSVVNAVLLSPLPYAEPDRLVTVTHFYPSLDGLEPGTGAPTYHDLRDAVRAFDGVAVRAQWQPNLTGEGAPERITGSRVSARFFGLLGVPAALGRTILPAELEAEERVAVLSHGLWQRRFGGDPAVIGRTLQLNGESHTVVGVMPPAFQDVTNPGAEVWAPLVLPAAQLADAARTNEFLTLVARLRPGVSLGQGQQELALLAEQLKREHPGSYPADWTLRVRSLDDLATGGVRPALLILLGAVGVVLLIACANVANLLLARAAARSKEIAVRRALGARGAHLVRQLLTESLILSLVGGALAVVLALGAVRLLVALSPANLPRVEEVAIDGTVLLFTLGLAIGTGLLFGLAPSLQATRADLQSTLRQGGRTGMADGGQTVRRALVVGQVALALTLLVAAGLLLRSFAEVQRVDPGFDPDRVLTANVSLPVTRYATSDERIAFFQQVLQRIGTIPGVEAVGATSSAPFVGGVPTRSFIVEGQEVPPDQQGPWGQYHAVDPDYHRALRVPLLRGRFFTEADRLGATQVAIVNDALARRYWPGEDPIGKRIAYSALPDGEPDWVEVVGVVGHTAQSALDDEIMVQLFRPYYQVGGTFLTLAIRTAGEPTAIAGQLRDAVQAVDPDQPIARVRTLDDLMTAAVGQRRFSTTLLGVFSGVALLLAGIGIYGVIAFDVTRRAQEMGIRMALGAGRGRILSLVLVRGLKLALAGVVLGLFGAFGATRLVESQLFGVSAADPATLLSVPGLLLGIALLAALVPALRATRADPIAALRAE